MKLGEKYKLHECRNIVFESGYMPTYILLSTLTAEGRKTIKGKPERIREVNKEIEAFGAKVISQYAVLGPYDFVNVVEAPDNETIARVSMELGARGTIQIMSMPAIPIDKFVATAKKSARKEGIGGTKAAEHSGAHFQEAERYGAKL
jgi:uncharacterized protein with GYD domain